MKNLELSDIYTPLKEDVVIEFKKVDKTEKGVYIPEQSQKEDKFNKVVAIGPECKRVKVGDIVFVSPTARPKIIELLQDNHVQIWESDILGIVDKEYYEVNKLLKTSKLAIA